MRSRKRLAWLVTLIASVAAPLAISGTVNAGLVRSNDHSVIWKRMFLTPADARLAVGGSDWWAYDPPRYRTGAVSLGEDGAAGSKVLCPKAKASADETLEGIFPGEDSAGTIYVAIYPFASASAAHREFQCLRGITTHLTAHGGDLSNLVGNKAGDERLGGGGDDNPMAFIRRGRYIAYFEVQRGYGPIGVLMGIEDSYLRQGE